MKFKWMLIVALAMASKVIAAQERSNSDSEANPNKVTQTELGQGEKEKLILNLSAAKDYALKYNRDIQNAGLAIDEANSQVWETLASGLPQVSANVDYTDYLGHEFFFPGSTEGVPNNPTSFLNVNVSQLLFSGSYIVGLQSAKLYKAMTEKNAEKSELDVKEQVASAYFNILLAERSKEIITRNLENVRDLYVNTEAMYKVGVSELTDVDQLSIQVTMLENSLRRTDRQVDMAYDLLKLQLGVDPKQSIELTQTLDDFLEMFDFYNALAKPFDLNNNVDYQLMESQEEITSKQVSLQKMEYLPTLTANYVRTEKIKAANFDMQPNNVLQLNLSIPIFSSGMRKSKVNQAKIQLETLQNNKAQLEDALLIQERQARLNLNTALEQYQSQKQNVDVAYRVFENINRKFQHGLVSSLDLTTANNNYLSAESDYIQSMLQVLDAHTTLEKLFNNL
ncbi:TolC family protein [Carboxylicivirga linearis]|uniref:TolC family protein n=1 Tax=Carboxylicivirga linearis TaxID=1628157 RepID=A0ABS5JPF5_9BACT|nr:TolC family protein [Carboxylicivirga linearis]MBS2096740.1 TolC family protein [Carboxylicivirga linearis]